MTIRVDVQRDVPAQSVPDDDFIGSWVSRAVVAAAGNRLAEVSVRVVGPDEMCALNREYRHQDNPTNVLSFPAGPVAGLPDGVPAPLGDIVVCADVVSAEALAQGKELHDHWAHLLVHGTLHLLGFDHMEDDEAAAMETLETRILGADGIPDPYGAADENC